MPGDNEVEGALTPCQSREAGQHSCRMKISLFSNLPYFGGAPRDVWPAPAASYAADNAVNSMQTALDTIKLADEAGFDWVSVAEHHFTPVSMSPNPMLMAGALTQIVKRAKIAILGATLPLLNPVRVAEEYAMLDTLSNGRVIAGMFRGTVNEYVTYNINPAESRERFEEALDLIRTAWRETQPFGWQGRYYQNRALCIWPRPVQPNGPPIFMSGSSPESGEYAAKNRVGLGLAFTTLPLAAKASAYYRDCAEKAGWSPTQNEILYRLTAHVAETDEQALEDARAAGAEKPRLSLSMTNRAVENAAAQSGYYGRDEGHQRDRLSNYSLMERVELGQLLLGGPETVLKQIARLKNEIGAGILDIAFIPQPKDKTRRAIDLIGEKILPRLKETA
jgi:alkanesulfonate monooxygenase SsuD/methylene tetrahydromethanopterin reductase-like flavin-dependent oxidoreductase (luciferase family)